MFAQIINNLMAIDPEMAELVEEEVRGVFERERHAVLKYQQSLATANVSRTSRGVDGMGWCIGEVPWAARAYWDSKLPGCWKTDEFRKDFFNRNKEWASRYERKPMISLALPENKVEPPQIFRAGKYARVTEMGGAA